MSQDPYPLVVPLALGAAVSPTLLTGQLLLLSGKVRPRARAWAFCGGVAVVDVAVVTLLATIASNVTLGSSDPSGTSRAIHGAAALALVALGVRALRRPEADQSHPSRVRDHLAEAGLGWFVGAGALLMALNFSSLVLMVPAVHDTVRDLDGPDQIPLLIFIALCAVAPVLLPVLAVTLLGHRAEGVLATLNRFTTSNAKRINAGIAFLFAAILGFSALRGL